ncbi:MAG: hypothetical protein WBW38_06895, partial [Candidatus Sulfotelmatobacter sp.]
RSPNRPGNSADKNSGIHEYRPSLYQFAKRLNKPRKDLKCLKPTSRQIGLLRSRFKALELRL